MNRKQHIETLNKTHRKQVAELQGECNMLLLKCTELEQSKQINGMEQYYDAVKDKAQKDTVKALKTEIDELKADKDRLQSACLANLTLVEQWRGDCEKLESDWEKASDKVSELETQRVWLLISTSTLLIALLICLFTR